MTTEATQDLVLGGVPASDLAREYGTPLLVIDTDVLDAAIARFASLGRDLGIDVAYAGKSFLTIALVQRLARSELGLDVCSLGELLVAERGGLASSRITFHGCGKTAAELRAICEGRAGRTVVDNAEELEQLANAADPSCQVVVLLRVNPGIQAETHRYVRTSGEGSKFGFAPESVEAAVARVLVTPGLQLAGLHAHIGSNIFQVGAYAAALEALWPVYARVRAAAPQVDTLILGGGFGVDPRPGGGGLDVAEILPVLADHLAALAREQGCAPPRLGIEPGRAIAAEAGTSLYRVVSIKHHGGRRFAIVDGGIADNPRPALYGAYHHPVACGRPFADASEATTICGRSCENDELTIAPLPVDLRAGDLLALGTTGAYTFSMASNYNRFPRPAVVFSGSGSHRVVVSREADADLLAHDIPE